jgi:hypothetical protein
MCEQSEHHPVLGTNKKVLHEVRDFFIWMRGKLAFQSRQIERTGERSEPGLFY